MTIDWQAVLLKNSNLNLKAWAISLSFIRHHISVHTDPINLICSLKKLTKKSTDFLEKGPIPLKYYLGEGGFTWITTYEKHKRRSRVNQDIIGCQTANQQDNWIGDFRIEHPLPEHYADPRIFIGKYDFQDGKGMVDAVGRKLTPRECLRLMGFSDKFRIVVDDHQAYHQSGNSIVVPVLKEIILTLIPYLKENA